MHKLWRVLLANSVERRNRNQSRVKGAIHLARQLQHPAVFITFDKLRAAGKFIAHETLRQAGELTVLDTYEMLVEFTANNATVFLSHRARRPSHAQACLHACCRCRTHVKRHACTGRVACTC